MGKDFSKKFIKQWILNILNGKIAYKFKYLEITADFSVHWFLYENYMTFLILYVLMYFQFNYVFEDCLTISVLKMHCIQHLTNDWIYLKIRNWYNI